MRKLLRSSTNLTLNCPHCSRKQTIKYGVDPLKTGIKVQKYNCKDCKKQFNERTGTPMSRLRHSSEKVATAIKMRSEGDGLRATARTLGKSHATIIGWKKISKNVRKMVSSSSRSRRYNPRRR